MSYLISLISDSLESLTNGIVLNTSKTAFSDSVNFPSAVSF